MHRQLKLMTSVLLSPLKDTFESLINRIIIYTDLGPSGIYAMFLRQQISLSSKPAPPERVERKTASVSLKKIEKNTKKTRIVNTATV